VVGPADHVGGTADAVTTGTSSLACWRSSRPSTTLLPAARGNVIHFQDGSWADTFYTNPSSDPTDNNGQLVSGDLTTYPDHSAIIFDTGTGTPTNPMNPNASLIVEFQTYANAGALVKDLESHSNGHYLWSITVALFPRIARSTSQSPIRTLLAELTSPTLN
jgi:hypothetical protein